MARIKTFLALLLLLPSYIFSANIVFDLGGVVFKTNTLAVVRDELGFTTVIRYLLSQCLHTNPCAWLQHPLTTAQQIFALEEHFFKALDQVPLSPAESMPLPPDAMYKGRKLPVVLALHIRGDYPSDFILEKVIESFQQIENESERELLIRVARVTFTPEKQAHIVQTIPECVDLIKQLKGSTDAQGTPNKLYIASNMNGEVFDALYRRHRELFDLFDGIVISGKEDVVVPAASWNLSTPEIIAQSHLVMKPQAEFFRKLLHNPAWNLEADNTFFIDDQEENYRSAIACGIKAYWCQNQQLSKCKQWLIDNGVMLTT